MNAMLEDNESVLCCADQFIEERNELSSLWNHNLGRKFVSGLNIFHLFTVEIVDYKSALKSLSFGCAIELRVRPIMLDNICGTPLSVVWAAG